MLNQNIPAAPGATLQASSATLPARSGGLLALAAEKLQKMKNALAGTNKKTLASATVGGPAPSGGVLGEVAANLEQINAAFQQLPAPPVVAPTATAAPIALPAPSAPVARAQETTKDETCGSCGHELGEDEKKYTCANCLSECCDSCADESEDGGILCPGCGSVAASAASTSPGNHAPVLSPRESLLAQLEVEKDPQEIYRLAARFNLLDGVGVAGRADASPAAGNDSEKASLLARLETEKDPQEIYRLAARINLLDGVGVAGRADASLAAGNDSEKASLLARLETEKDPQEIYRLAARINLLDGVGVAGI